jgi:hypothetical protein
VTQHLCPRCRTVIKVEDEGSLIFCWNCGAPQVQLSEDLREQAEQLLLAPDPSVASASTPPPADDHFAVWTGAIQTAGLAGAIAAVLTVLSFVIPPVVLLSVFWAFAAPMVALRLFLVRFRQAPITAAFAARLGVLTGLAVLVAITAINTISLVLTRFVLHAAGPLDNQLAATFAQERTLMTDQLGTQAAPILHMLSIPEFRAGLLMSGFAVFACVYILYTATIGSLAGYFRSRAQLRRP